MQIPLEREIGRDEESHRARQKTQPRVPETREQREKQAGSEPQNGGKTSRKQGEIC